MNIQVDRVESPKAIAIVRLEGDLDASNFESLIERARQIHDDGTTEMLLDMRAVPYMGSSGLVALHAIALLLAGQAPVDPGSGWAAHHAIEQSVDAGLQDHLRILVPADPASPIRRVLQRTGMDRFIAVHTDEADALAAF